MANQSQVSILVRIQQKGAEILSSVRGQIAGLADGVMTLQAAFVALVASAVVNFAEKVVLAFADQEQAVIRLNAALRVTGRYSDEATDKIQDAAKAMERLTGIKATDVIAATAAIASLAHNLTPDQLIQAQQAAIGLSQAFGIDLNRAAILVSKSITGTFNGLARYGVVINKGGTETERFNQIVAKTAPLFDIAVESSQSLTGQLRMASSAWFNLQATMGQIIVSSLGFDRTQHQLSDTINRQNAELRENIGWWTKVGKIIVDVVMIIVDSITAFVRLGFYLGEQIGSWAEGWVNAIAGNVVAGLNIFSAHINDWVTASIAKLNSFIDWVNDHMPTGMQSWGHINFQFHINDIDPQPFFDRATISLDEFNTAGERMQDVVRGMRTDWGNLFRDLMANPLPPAAFDIRHTGGGKNAPPIPNTPTVDKQAMKLLEDQARLLERQLSDNVISIQQYGEALTDLVPRMLRFRATLSGDDLVRFDERMLQLKHTSEQVGLTWDQNGVRALKFGEAFTIAANKSVKAMGSLNQVMANMTMETFKGFEGAVKDAFAAFIDGSQKAGTAFGKAMLSALSSVAEGFGQFFMARATGALAEFIGGNPAGLASAAKFAAAATAMFALSGVLAGLSSNLGSGGGGGGGGGPQANATAQNGAQFNAGGTATITIEGGLLDMSDPRQADALAHAIQTLSGRRIIITGG